MKKVVFILSHIPNPRMLKRIKTIESEFSISVIYWDRGQSVKETFEINPKHNVQKILIKAPFGQPFKRIVPWLRYFKRSLNIVKKESPSIIHVGNLDMLLIAIYYKKFYCINTKIIYEVADLPKHAFIKKPNNIKDFLMIIMKKIEKKSMNKVSKLIVTSPYFWDNYYSQFTKKNKYMFLPNAPYKNLFKNYQKKDKDIFTIGFIGSVRFPKQLKMLIDVVEEIDEDINVFIAGSGPSYNEIEEISRNKKFVNMYGPYNYEKEIVRLYEKVDCMYSVYNTKTEGVRVALPNRLYEAIVCEIPIIGASGTVLGEFIENNNIGTTIRYNDKKALKKKILQMINSKEQMNLYKDNCNKIKENYYYEENSKRLLKEYKNL